MLFFKYSNLTVHLQYLIEKPIPFYIARNRIYIYMCIWIFYPENYFCLNQKDVFISFCKKIFPVIFRDKNQATISDIFSWYVEKDKYLLYVLSKVFLDIFEKKTH